MRLFLHMTTPTGELVKDPNGKEYPSLESAEAEAIGTAKAIIADWIKDKDWQHKSEPAGYSIIIEDSNGQELMRVPFTEAMPRGFTGQDDD